MKVAVVGCGNWGTAASKLIAENIQDNKDFDRELVLWTFEEGLNGRKLSEELNQNHENPKYLPGIKLPENIRARVDTDLSDCDIIVFCLPHQFINKLRNFSYKKTAFGVNLSKGMVEDGDKLYAPSPYISKMLGMDCSCVMGANIATEVANQEISDSTIGYAHQDHIKWLRAMFSGRYFIPEITKYNIGIEICGAIKNIMSVAYGMSVGQSYGKNTTAMLFRRSLLEIKRFSEAMGADIDVLWSACVGDLLVSCLCGRNYKSGVKMGEKGLSIEKCEEELNGQKLQGPCTAKTVVNWLKKNGHDLDNFPIIHFIYRVCYENEPCSNLLEVLRR